MNHRSYSVDYSHLDGVTRPHDYSRSWSVCEDFSYCPPPATTRTDDDDMPDPSVVYPQATSMDDKCGYRTGKCFNMRAMKRNGKDHKLCDFHREKANQNQKKLDRKKRMKRFAPYQSTPRSSFVVDKADPSASPTRIDEAPEVLHFDEVAFFCDVMTPAEKLALEEAHAIFVHDLPTSDHALLPPIHEAVKDEAPEYDHTAAELDMLFKSDVMLFVDQL
ncbi:hypothetical protein H310_10851 [Aphanomyces invadans]|uniref:Uncharacterized protein n=1 Tax=Aphanomyces invadans TaxID=157072 RepID=A0A024TQ99_9STRA|nr:hypothetical protein H310_10851 [Aphanomyces invadans]ETV95796.1 hypothetical protein H310_10851 [Aphanomyces invadans]|eukprot:XP_008875547.1 hypothetical protein H310_10851 [Aphanomyces invadans]